MKRILALLATLALLSVSLANPYVWSSDWTTAEAGEAVHGGTYRLAEVGDLRTFNPMVSAESTSATDLIMNLGALLVRQTPDSDEYTPYAAESMEVSEDGMTIDFTLRDGLKWSDGSDITIEDYYTTWLLEVDPEVGSNGHDSWFLEGNRIEAEVTGANSIRITFPAPDRTALPVAAMLPTPPVFREVYEAEGAEGVQALWGTDVDLSTTVWSGPFVPETFVAGERIIMKRNPHFGNWNVDEQGNELPYFDSVNYTIVTDLDAALNLYLAGETDAFSPRNLDDIGVINQAVQAGDISATILEGYSPVDSSQFIVWNWNMASNPAKQELFRSIDFRRAMAHLVDRDAMIELIYSGMASPMYTSVYQVLDYWVTDDIEKYDFDPEKALELLAGLGYSQTNEDGILVNAQGETLSWRLATNAGSTQREDIIQIFADTAREYGVDVITEAYDFNLLVDQLLSVGEDRPFEAILMGLTGGSNVWPFGSNVVPCGTNLHMFNTTDSCISPFETELEALYWKGRKTLDTDEAREIGFEMQQLEAEFLPILYTVSPLAHASWSTSVAGHYPEELMNTFKGISRIELLFKK